MAENFDSLSVLLKLVEPGLSPNQVSTLSAQLNKDQWEELISEASRQDIAPYFYNTLIKLNIFDKFDLSQCEIINQIHLSNTVRNMLFLHETKIILAAIQSADLPVTGLKGVYLLDHIYPDIGARSMSDIDLLVRRPDLPKCLEVMKGLGYQTVTYFNLADQNSDTKHIPPMQRESGAMVEVHWTLLEEDEPFTIDADALWERTLPAKIANVDAFSLGIEDLILHLCLHLTYQHYLNLGLRGLLDIAMVIHKFQSQIDWKKLVEIAKAWGAEKVTALTLKLVETQLNVPIPAEVINSLLPKGIPPSLLGQARSQLLERVRFEDRLTPDLVKMNASKNIFSKIKIGLQRVFISRLALARTYNISPSSPKIIYFYWIRAKYLIRNYGSTLRRLLKREKTTAPALQKAEASYSLHDWMKPNNN